MMEVAFIAVSASVGALTLAVLGFLNSGEAFNPRKFIGSAITAIVAGVGVAVAFKYTNGVGLLDILGAFLTGVGADAGRKALADLTRAKE